MSHFLSPDLHDITSICARFFVVISAVLHCQDVIVLISDGQACIWYLEPTSGSELRGNLGESWAVSVRLGGSWHGAGGAGVNTDIT